MHEKCDCCGSVYNVETINIGEGDVFICKDCAIDAVKEAVDLLKKMRSIEECKVFLDNSDFFDSLKFHT